MNVIKRQIIGYVENGAFVAVNGPFLTGFEKKKLSFNLFNVFIEHTHKF